MTTQIPPQSPPYIGAPGPIRPTLNEPVNGYPHHYPPYSPEVRPEKPKSSTGKVFAGALALLLVGGGIGYGVTTATASEPTSTGTVPAACLSAIAEARQDYSTFADVLGASLAISEGIPDALESAMYLDVDGIEDFTAIITDANGTLERANAALDRSTFADDAAACEGASA